MPGIKYKGKEYEPGKEYVKEYITEKDPKGVSKWRRKVVYDKNGYKHVLTIAIKSNGKTEATSILHPKEEPKAKKVIKGLKRKGVKTAAYKNKNFYMLKTQIRELPALVRSTDTVSRTYFSLYSVLNRGNPQMKNDEYMRKTKKKKNKISSPTRKKKSSKKRNKTASLKINKYNRPISIMPKTIGKATGTNGKVTSISAIQKVRLNKNGTPVVASRPSVQKKKYTKDFQKILNGYMEKGGSLTSKFLGAFVKNKSATKTISKTVKSAPKVTPKNLYAKKVYTYNPRFKDIQTQQIANSYKPHIKNKATNMSYQQRQNLSNKLLDAKEELQQKLKQQKAGMRFYS